MSNFDEELVKLYSVQAQIKEDPYLHAHSRNLAVIRRQTSIFERCQEFFKDTHTVLDCGCVFGADAEGTRGRASRLRCRWRGIPHVLRFCAAQVFAAHASLLAAVRGQLI